MKVRIIGFDLARALAVFGMVLVNFKIAMGLGEYAPSTLLDMFKLLEGRAAATFVVLAGIGLALMTNSARRNQDLERRNRHRKSLLKRALILFVIGLAYTPIWPADILHFYGVYIAAAVLLLYASERVLWTWIFGLVLGFFVSLFMFDYEAGWNFATLTYLDFWTLEGMLRHLLFNGFHPALPWLAFMLLGLILGRLDWNNKAVRKKVFAWGAGVFILAELTSRAIIYLITDIINAAELLQTADLFGASPMPPVPLYMLAGGGFACAVIAKCVDLGLRYEHSRIMKALVATGQMSLTLYVAHVIIGLGVLEALGMLVSPDAAQGVAQGLWLTEIMQALGLGDLGFDPKLLVYFVAVTLFCGSSVLFASLWLKRFARGPLEIVLRRMG